MKFTTKLGKTAAVSLSALLCISMIPVAGCVSEKDADPKPAMEVAPIGAAEDPGGSARAQTINYDPSGYLKPEEKWGAFEDGSKIIDIVETQVFANATTQKLTVKLENGAELAGDIAASDVTLTGGLADWATTSIVVTSPTEFVVTADLADGKTPSAAASIAGIELDSACVKAPAADTAAIDAQMSEMIASEPNAELAEGIEATAADANGESAGGESSIAAPQDNAAAPADNGPSSHTAFIPYVHPSMQVDVDDSNVADKKTTYRIVSCEFAFPENITIDDFRIDLTPTAPEQATEPSLENFKRLGDFEIEITVSEDAGKLGSSCDWAFLQLAPEASGTGGAVACSLALPDAWIDARVTAVNDQSIDQIASSRVKTDAQSENTADSTGATDFDEMKTITIDAAVHNTETVASDISVSALCSDGSYRELTDANVEAAEGGRVNVTLDADKLEEVTVTADSASSTARTDGEVAANAALAADAANDGFAIVSIDTGEVARAYGGMVDPDASLLYIPLEANSLDELLLSNSCLIADIPAPEATPGMSIDFAELAQGGAKSLLSGIAGSAWSYVRSTWLINTPLGEHTVNELYNNIVKMQTELSNLSTTLDALVDKESAHYNASIVNAANAKIARIQSEYALLGGLYKQVVAAQGDDTATAAAIDNLMSAKKNIVDNMLVDMGELYNIIKTADASSGRGLVAVYDSMAALSYNWGSAAQPGRQSYRDAISEVWLGCTTMLYVVCGAPQYADEYSIALGNLENMTKDVNKLLDGSTIDKTQIERSCSATDLAGGNKFVTPDDSAHYCYTTNEWYALCLGTSSTTGWSNALFTTKKRGKTFDYFSTSPFIAWKTFEMKPSWGGYYLTTEQAKAMSARLGKGRSLLEELSNATGATTYLLANPSFSIDSPKTWHNDSNWYFDTFELKDDMSTVITERKLHFEGDVEHVTFKKAVKTVVSSTDLGQMGVLARVKLS